MRLNLSRPFELSLSTIKRGGNNASHPEGVADSKNDLDTKPTRGSQEYDAPCL